MVFRRRRRSRSAIARRGLPAAAVGGQLAVRRRRRRTPPPSRRTPELPRGGRVDSSRATGSSRSTARRRTSELGALGIGTPAQAATQAARPGARLQPPEPAGAAGPRADRDDRARRARAQDGLHRERQSAAVIRRYLAAARRIKGAPDPRHPAGPGGLLRGGAGARALPAPAGRRPGARLRSGACPRASCPDRRSARPSAADGQRGLVRTSRGWSSASDLPQKLLLVHQFTEEMVHG